LFDKLDLFFFCLFVYLSKQQQQQQQNKTKQNKRAEKTFKPLGKCPMCCCHLRAWVMRDMMRDGGTTTTSKDKDSASSVTHTHDNQHIQQSEKKHPNLSGMHVPYQLHE
jgi:hypothetical protein